MPRGSNLPQRFPALKNPNAQRRQLFEAPEFTSPLLKLRYTTLKSGGRAEVADVASHVGRLGSKILVLSSD